MERGSFFILPLHVRPVVSYTKLKKKNSLERARSGLDRLNLTDVGERILSTWIGEGGFVKMGKSELPFPWSATLSTMKVERARISGIMVQGTTYRSVFRIDIPDPISLLKRTLDDFDRNPLESPYWDSETWMKFHSATGITKKKAKEMNRKVLK